MNKPEENMAQIDTNQQNNILEKEDIERQKVGENDPLLFENIDDPEFERVFFEALNANVPSTIE